LKVVSAVAGPVVVCEEESAVDSGFEVHGVAIFFFFFALNENGLVILTCVFILTSKSVKR
jgi:hypothetical protein